MPRGDRMGPMGVGPRTGRGTGFCNGYNNPGFTNQGFGRGFFKSGSGSGFGKGRGRMFWSNLQNPVQQHSKDQEKQILENELKQLETEENEIRDEKELIKKRIEELN
jgi:hypothetical protein